MSKVLIFSDLHCHSHKNSMKRLEDCLKVLQWVFDTAIAEGIKVIVFAGDLFQDRERIYVISYEKTYKAFLTFCEANPEVKIFLLLGNHDMWFHSKWDVSSISPLAAIKNVFVIDKPSALQIADDCVMDFLPYTKNPAQDVKTYFPEKNRVLISHVALDGATLNAFYNTKAEVSVEYEGDMVKVGAESFQGWERVFLGHYHCAQKINNVVEYIGSPLELNFSEAHQEKHIIVFDTDTLETKYVINDFSPKHLVVKESELNEIDLKNNFVQILVEDITSVNLIDIRKSVKDKGLATLDFKEKPKTKNEEIIKIDLAGGDLLEKWIKAKNPALDHSDLLKIGQEIIKELS